MILKRTIQIIKLIKRYWIKEEFEICKKNNYLVEKKIKKYVIIISRIFFKRGGKFENFGRFK